jgi:hypothetical protein
MAEKYNGWTNYETWVTKLWMDNSEGDQEYYAEMAQDAYKDSRFRGDIGETRERAAAYSLAEALESSFDEAAEDWMPDQTGYFADILNAGLAAINWHEIAGSLLDEVNKEEQEVV